MSSPSRSAQFAKVHRVLKKYYKPVTPDPQRPVLEHLLFACCLENAPYDKAEEAHAALVHTFFDWNEIRVTTIKELAEVIAGLPDANAAAQKIKKILQHVFESSYSFDLEEVRKKNLGPAVERLQKIDGASKFVCEYVIQSALGGHAIPLDSGTMAVLRLLDLATDKDVEAQTVPGLERAIAKNKGIEFGSLLHQLGADFTANPYLPALHRILLQINPDIEAQLPKRRSKKAEPETPAPAAKPAAKSTARPAAVDAEAVPPSGKPGKGKAKAEAAVVVETAPATEPAATPAGEEGAAKARKKKKLLEPAAPAAPPAAAADHKPAPPPAGGKSPAAAAPAAAPPPPAKPVAAAGETAAAEKKLEATKKKPVTLKKVSPDDEEESEAAAKRSAAVVGLSKKKPR
jgi:endonuclease-3